ncbi:MAG: F0F1 ATP synthase subunit B [Candidatus Paceibacterota bacterium]|jgi:F-type H+-transporting ATPase subunit b
MMGIDWKILLGEMINFLIVLFLLKKFALGPFLKILRERKQKIEEGLERSKVAEEKIKEIRTKREEIIAKAQQKAIEIFDQGKKKGDEKIRSSILLGEQERLNILQTAKKETQREIDKMKDAEKEREISVALSLAEKILGEKLDAKKDEALINKLLAAQK